MDVRTLCLGLLTRSDASGYEIKKAFESGLSHFYDASFGSIYPALSRLTEEGLVTCKEEPQDKRPDKKVYRITPVGRLAFIDALGKAPGHDRIRSDFLATILFADLLSPRQIAGLIDGRLTETRRHLAELREQAKDAGRAAGDRFVIAYGIAVLEAEVGFLEERRHVIEGAALLGRPPGSAAAD